MVTLNKFSTKYMDANGNEVGHSHEDSYGSSSSFKLVLGDIPLDSNNAPVVDAGTATHDF